MKIGEAMIELRFIPEEHLNTGLKLQKWIAETSDKSIFIDGILQAENYSNKNTKTITKNASNILDYIIPVFSDSTKVFMPSDTKDKNFVTKLSIIDEKSSLLKIFEENKQLFENQTDYFDFILRLDNQELLSYKKNDNVESRDTWIRFGELAVTLGLVTEKQVEETFPYRQKNSHRNIFIGEALVELNYLENENLESVLKIQRWLNMVLAKVSYENAMITAIKEVLEDHFKTPTEIGRFRKMAFQKPLQNMICITYTISGKLNGQIYYIFDRPFVENLSKKLMASYGIELQTLDESIVTELCNILTGSSLTKLSKIGIFCETNIPKINMEEQAIVANKQVISVLPLMSPYGRFVVGFLLKS